MSSETCDCRPTTFFLTLTFFNVILIFTCRSKNVPLSGPLIRAKAEELASSLGENNWTCSNSWLQRWKTRHGILFKVIHGERGDVNEQSTDAWVEEVLRPTLARFEPDNVYNLDETALFWRLLPDKTFSFKGEKCTGGKKSRERITVMLCCNMSGKDKCKPVVIGKYANPRCFKHAKAGLPVRYYNNNSSWMTRDIFQEWIISFDKEMGRQGRKVLLVMDNCSSHKAPDLRSVEVLFIPPNATSKLQPLDAGIICNMKTHYRKALVFNLLAHIDGGGSDYRVSLLDSIHMLTQSWDKVTSDTIANSFRKAGFHHSSDELSTPEPVSTDREQQEPLLSRLFQEWNVPPSDYFTVNDEVITEDLTAPPAAAAAPSTSSVPGPEAGDASSEEDEVEMPQVFAKEAMASANLMNIFCMQSENIYIFF